MEQQLQTAKPRSYKVICFFDKKFQEFSFQRTLKITIATFCQVLQLYIVRQKNSFFPEKNANKCLFISGFLFQSIYLVCCCRVSVSKSCIVYIQRISTRQFPNSYISLREFPLNKIFARWNFDLGIIVGETFVRNTAHK